METLHILNTSYVLNTSSVLLGMDSYMFRSVLAEFYAILEEHIQVALEMLEVGICSLLVLKTDQSDSVMFRSGECAGQGRC
jgi:hypothetical protein